MNESNINPVKLALMLACVSQADIATRCERSAAQVSAIVNGRGRSKKIERCIAVATGVFPEKLWPQWYGPKVKAKRVSSREVNARLDAVMARQEAA